MLKYNSSLKPNAQQLRIQMKAKLVIELVFCQTYLDGLGCRGRPTCLPKIATLRADT
jgi:hypothetical protein